LRVNFSIQFAPKGKREGAKMRIEKKALIPERVRKTEGNFSYIPFRFLSGGFFNSLSRDEKLVYFLLIMVSDRQGLSYYSQDKMSTLLELNLDEFIEARNGLIEKSLIAFDGLLFQVLSLPKSPLTNHRKPLKDKEDFMREDRLTQRSFFNSMEKQEQYRGADGPR